MTTAIRPEQASAFGDEPCAECSITSESVDASYIPASALPPVGTSVTIADAAKRSWIVIKVVDADDQPVGGARLRVALPKGGTLEPRVDRKGKVRIEGIDAGVCTVTLRDPEMRAMVPYKVKTGDSIDSLARAGGLTWQELARLNWGTANPDDINEHLRDDVGCTRKTASGKNYVFTSEDVPGTILVPAPPFEFETEREHVIKLHEDPGPSITLENEEGVRIPEAEFVVTFANGSQLRGRLGRKGRHRLVDPPKGRYSVVYPDEGDVYAKSLAALVRHGFDAEREERDDPDDDAPSSPTAHLFRVLVMDTSVVKAVFAAYDRYWNDLSGNGLRGDIDRVVTDEEARLLADFLLESHGLATSRPIDVAREPDEMAADEVIR